MARLIYTIDEIDFDFVELAYFKTAKEAEDLKKKLFKKLDFIIVKYSDEIYSVGLKYKLDIKFKF